MTDLGRDPAVDAEANADGSTKRMLVQLAAFDGFAALDFAKREETARIKLPDLHTGVDMDAGRLDAPSHGIGVHPDGKPLWVTSIPQNAVFVYSLADLKLVGQIARRSSSWRASRSTARSPTGSRSPRTARPSTSPTPGCGR
jgi:hypothetical protein